ncbi:hypothetical protein EMCRGX_G031773 [Ephydatia muelleri]|eukprot:Em0018g212a
MGMERLALLALVLSSISAAPVLKDTKCAGILNNSPMAPITAFNAAGISEIKRVTASLLQAIGALMEQLYETFKISNPYHHPCNSAVVRSLDSGLNVTERLTIDYYLLINLTRLLNNSIDYDTHYHNGNFVVCLEQVFQQLEDITAGLSILLNASLAQTAELRLPSSDTESPVLNNGTDQPTGQSAETSTSAQPQLQTNDRTQSCIQLQIEYQTNSDSESELCRCLGVVTSDRDEVKNVYEVWLGLNALFADFTI